MSLFDWIWLFLFVVIVTVRKAHERRSGAWTSLKNTPALEATLMMLWGIAVGILPFIYLFSDGLDFADWRIRSNSAGSIGTVLFLGSIWLLHRSHADLGKAWSSEITPHHGLVTRGVYKRIRHPMYSAHLLWGMSQCLMLTNWLAGCFPFLLVIVLLLVRIPREEQALSAEFGNDYKAYCERAGRLFPKY